jgi:hypothetical protein
MAATTFKAQLPAKYSMAKSAEELRACDWIIEGEIYGEKWQIANFVNFRVGDNGMLYFDMVPITDFAAVLVADYEAGRVELRLRVDERDDGAYLLLEMVGRLSVPNDPPTTVCMEGACGVVFPAVNAYKSTRDGRLVCPSCFNKGEHGGRMRLRREG